MTQSAYIPLGGGIDLVTPPALLTPGKCLSAVNYDCPITGGYRRIEGYTQIGPEVPGTGPMLGVVSFATFELAVRQQVDIPAVGVGDPTEWAAMFVREGDGESETWRFVSEVNLGRHEWTEGNVLGTEGGRRLYGVGGGKPFTLALPATEVADYASITALITAMESYFADGVTFANATDVLTLKDPKGRSITGAAVIGRDGTTLLSLADVAGNGSTTTEMAIDLAGIGPNTIERVTFTVGSLPEMSMIVPDKALAYAEIANAPSGAVVIDLFKNHLFLGFTAGSLQHSSTGEPDDWDASTGSAGEIGVGQTLTGLVLGRGGVLHVLCRDSIQTLYGTSSADWRLDVTVPTSGARPYSGQSLMMPYFIAERGISSLEATDAYGDFRPMQPGYQVEPIFLQERLFTRVKASAISKQRAQYRVWFDNGTGIYMSPTGITTVRFPAQVEVAHSGERDTGAEVLLFGDDQGNVYRLDNNATSFNGAPIEAFLTLAYNTLKSPSVRKRFRRVFWDVRSGSDANISILPDFDYGRVETATPRREFIQFLLGGGLWDIDNWNQFSWSTPSLGQEPMNVSGTGTAINFAIYSSSDSEPHEILGYDIHFEQRRRRRG
tara:strand:+ start:545 stop:2365 length:1821 start_codon:yes stop_codon:yes gene_type:complete